jgi:catechol 2,3-dioxygenase
VLLGAGGRVLLELRGDPAARRHSPQEAGLFHTAFLLPSRAALARWLVHAADSRLALQGASDQRVSEAIYLSDPEANGIEVYADRPRDAWYGPDGTLGMTTLALDLNALARSANSRWTGIPDDAVVGHVHLQVGAVPEAEAFYHGSLGLPVMAQYPGAAFFGSGGYHHHIAANVWNSRGAAPRRFPATGLAALELLTGPAEYDAITARGGSATLADPWGTPVLLTRKDA